jgi:hypothetical protein
MGSVSDLVNTVGVKFKDAVGEKVRISRTVVNNQKVLHKSKISSFRMNYSVNDA